MRSTKGAEKENKQDRSHQQKDETYASPDRIFSTFRFLAHFCAFQSWGIQNFEHGILKKKSKKESMCCDL